MDEWLWFLSQFWIDDDDGRKKGGGKLDASILFEDGEHCARQLIRSKERFTHTYTLGNAMSQRPEETRAIKQGKSITLKPVFMGKQKEMLLQFCLFWDY
jgi:hypothetical protein